MMGQKSNRGPIQNTGPENIPGSGFKKKPSSPFDGLVKPKPKLKPPKGAQQFASDVARQEGRYVPAADQSRPVKPLRSPVTY